jgi:trans-aconitate 2-methyltransferase
VNRATLVPFGLLQPSEATVNWSAQQYVAFEDQRTRPVRDLLAALPPMSPRDVIDLGCGPGNSTELLAARFPTAHVRGLDSSSDMIAAARKRLPGVNFEEAEIEQWVGVAGVGAAGADAADVILANAVLHWLPDHASLFPALIGRLTAGGALAVQMPDNLDDPAHVAMREVATSGTWAAKLASAVSARTVMPEARWYHELMRSLGCEVDVWRTTYHHRLPGGATDVVEWFKGSGLRPFLAPLSDDERIEYLLRYRTRVADAYPPSSDGSVLLPFPRLFIVAVRA